MTNKHQVKPAKPAAVELNDAALDRAAGGGGNALFRFYGDADGDAAVRTITDGTSNTILKG